MGQLLLVVKVFEKLIFRLDHWISGLQRGHLTVLVGRPSMGKTSFVLSVAKNVVNHQKIPVLYFSIRESKEKIALRLVCSQSRVNAHNIKSGFLSPTDWPKLTAAAGVLADAPLYVDDSLLSIEQIEKTIKYYVSHKKVGLVIIDALQEIEGGFFAETRERRRKTEDFCRIIKRTAVQQDIPILLTYWAPRSFEDDYRKVPALYNFSKEDGNLPCYADEILMLYREEYYFPTDSNSGATDIRVIKSETESVTINIHFIRECCLFEDWEITRTGGV
ncbi:MAG: DnaB-like helicase C-terminal domain-containing protein [Candidatus Omnitrophica bacterium]|nr:DnaB-like helicase C-terminal domain-containing protein [Candidatus Omnitrophota bacterium]